MSLKHEVFMFTYQQLRLIYEAELKQGENVSTLATNIIGWNGIIISILLAGGAAIFANQKIVVW
jgi:hypothetical protein